MELIPDRDTLPPCHRIYWTDLIRKIHLPHKVHANNTLFLGFFQGGNNCFCSSSPITPSSPACGLSPNTAIRGRTIIKSSSAIYWTQVVFDNQFLRYCIGYFGNRNMTCYNGHPHYIVHQQHKRWSACTEFFFEVFGVTEGKRKSADWMFFVDRRSYDSIQSFFKILGGLFQCCKSGFSSFYGRAPSSTFISSSEQLIIFILWI